MYSVFVMASLEAETPEVLFFQDQTDAVFAQVTDPPPSPVTIHLGKKEEVLQNLAKLSLNIKIARGVMGTVGLIGVLDGGARILGGVLLSVTQRDLEPVYLIVSGMFEGVLGVTLGVSGLDINKVGLDRIRLIRNRWVTEKINQIPLDQAPVASLAEVAPHG